MAFLSSTTYKNLTYKNLTYKNDRLCENLKKKFHGAEETNCLQNDGDLTCFKISRYMYAILCNKY